MKEKGLVYSIEKDTVTKDIIKVTDKIENAKKALFYCDNLIERTIQIKENIKYLKEEKRNKQNNKEQKKKERRVK